MEVEGFKFDCMKLKQDLWNKGDFRPNAPTADYKEFTRLFREVAKHPTRATFEVPHLPLKDEISKDTIPFPNPDSDPDVYQLQAQAAENEKKRGRDKVKQNSKVKTTFRSHFLVSITFEEKTIYLLHKRVDVYMIAVRDSKGQWWVFGKVDGALFTGTKALGFSESYTDMEPGDHRGDHGKAVHLGYHQLVSAFHDFAEPEGRDLDRLKISAQILIALSSEGGRSVVLANEFGIALADTSGSKKVLISTGSFARNLMKNWQVVSNFITNHSGSEDGKKEITEFKNSILADFSKEFKKAGMIRLEDAKEACGLLKA